MRLRWRRPDLTRPFRLLTVLSFDRFRTNGIFVIFRIEVPSHLIYFGSGIDEPELNSLPTFVLIVTDSLLARNRLARWGEGKKGRKDEMLK